MPHNVVTCNVNRDISTAYCLTSSGDKVDWIHIRLHPSNINRHQIRNSRSMDAHDHKTQQQESCTKADRRGNRGSKCTNHSCWKPTNHSRASVRQAVPSVNIAIHITGQMIILHYCWSLPVPPNTCMSSCSSMYMRNVLTWGNRPTRKINGKPSIKPARNIPSISDCMWGCFDCMTVTSQLGAHFHSLCICCCQLIHQTYL